MSASYPTTPRPAGFPSPIDGKGEQVIEDYRLFLATGNVRHVTPGLRHLLTNYTGFAQAGERYDIDGFRQRCSSERLELVDWLSTYWPCGRDAQAGYEADGLSVATVLHRISLISAAAIELIDAVTARFDSLLADDEGGEHHGS